MWLMPSSSPISVVVARKSSRRHQLPALIPLCANTYILLFYLMHRFPLTLMLAGTAYNTYSIVYTSFIQISHQLGSIPVHGACA